MTLDGSECGNAIILLSLWEPCTLKFMDNTPMGVVNRRYATALFPPDDDAGGAEVMLPCRHFNRLFMGHGRVLAMSVVSLHSG